MDTDSLKSQLKLLNEQQKKRLQRKAENKKKMTTLSADAAKRFSSKDDPSIDPSFNIDDDLGLDIPSNYVSQEQILQSDHIQNMEQTIRELQDESGRLFKLLGEKETEIKIIKQRWKAEKEEFSGSGYAAENASQKIVELSKKVRDLNAEIEKEKTNTQQWRRTASEFESKIISNKPIKSVTPTLDETEKRENELNLLREKLQMQQLKSAEERNEIESLRKDIKLAKKVLEKEVGDKVNFHDMLHGSSGWKGAQQLVVMNFY